jgi:hypothetical protein
LAHIEHDWLLIVLKNAPAPIISGVHSADTARRTPPQPFSCRK